MSKIAKALNPEAWREERNMNFFDDFDAMADRAADGIKAAARRFVAAGAIAEPDAITDLWEAKAALCAALRQEAHQWRPPHRQIATEAEANLMQF